ncbi:hypothetical protein CIHG_07424 [Coccidioides immitis H538.4]|uniref:Uncharacterized protein n=1 Tax=Coccidioides immitis H538.4 TaxID=396776 RepID=A0A0J8UQ22_COCIT|nr:hypothetical protein CIHG_07424 [Coccidioides immitis H538.4]
METLTAAVPSSPSSGSTFPTSVYDHTSLSNTTSSPLALLPSIPKEFFMLSLRFIYRVELFLFVTLPGSVVRALGLDRLVGSLIERGADLIGELGGVIDDVL